MMDIGEQLRNHAASDHKRGCQGRQYSCECGYDGTTELLLGQAADEIRRLRAAMVRALAQHDEIERLRAALQFYAKAPVPMKSALTPGHCDDGTLAREALRICEQ
jgi:hypothetical protein